MARKSKTNDDLRVEAAKAWAKDHQQSVHDAFRDRRFQSRFNKYVENPSFATRRNIGLHPKKAERERAELRLVKVLKRFGDSP